MSVRTILFDLDGTLIDTNELIIASFDHTFKHYNLPYTREEIIGFNGPPLRDTFHQIDPGHAEKMIATYREHNLKHHDSYVIPFPHVAEVLEQLEGGGIQLGIVTTKMRKSVEMGLAVTGIARYFETVVTYDDVEHAKPHPEPVVRAMEALGADAASTIMVGDNYHDIESGKNAGVQTAGVAWAHKGSEFLRQYKPTYMLEDMRDLLQIVKV
jgi:pyrophosphatase PpaX